MERKKVDLILENINSVYKEFKKFIQESFPKFKNMCIEENDIVSWGNDKDIKNKKIEDYCYNKEKVDSAFINMKNKNLNIIEDINKLKKEIEESLNESPFLTKNPLICKFLLELPSKINVIHSYLNLIENEIKNYKYENIDMILNMINVSMQTIKISN